MVARPCSAVRSPVTFISAEPYRSLPSWSKVAKEVPGVGRLVAERPVQLGGVADRLVDGQPQVGRVDDQVVRARPRRSARASSRRAAPGSAPARRPSPSRCPVRYSQPRPTGGAMRAHRVELAARLVDGDGGELRVQPHPLLRGDGARGVGVELVLLHGEQRGVRHGRRPSARQQPRAPVGEQRRSSPRRARRTGRSRTRRPTSAPRAPARPRARPARRSPPP